MNGQQTFAVLVALTAATATADRVRTSEESIVGEVVASRRTGVVVSGDSGRVTVPVEQVRAILYDNEPTALAQARQNAARGGYADVLERLADVTPTGAVKIDREVRHLRALASARLAIATGEGVKDAGRALTAFLREHGDSHHYLPAVEALGDLLAAIGRTDNAVKRYRLMTAEGVDGYAARAELRIAMAYDRAERWDEARDAYRTAANAAARGSTERFAATLGEAIATAATGRTDDGLRTAREMVVASEGEATRLAIAYNALGRCYAVAGRDADAAFAWLHTDLLYSEDTDRHAEALYRLTKSWDRLGRTAEATDARTRLERRYAATQWAGRLRRR